MRVAIQIGAVAAAALSFATAGGAARAQSTCATDAICTYPGSGAYNWLVQQNTNPFGGESSAAGQYALVLGDFYPNPFPASWSSPPNFATDQQPFGQGTTVIASVNGVSFPPNSPPVQYQNAPGEPYGYWAEIPYSPNLVGAWNLSVSHPGYTTGNFTTNDTTGTPFIPVANSVYYDSLSPTATIHWTFPTVNVPTGMRFTVNFAVLNASGQLIDFYGGLPGSQRSMDLGNLPPNSNTAGNPPTIPLEAGHKYVILVDGSLDGNGGALGYDQYSESISYNAFTPTTASPAFAGPIYTPNVVSGAGGGTTYQFSMSVAAGTTYNIDPEMAHGFIYETGAGDPNFATVELPNIGNLGDYALYLWRNGKWVFDANVAPDSLFNFGPGGVSEFEVLGINPGLDPSNGNEFVTQVSFVGGGTFTGTMTAVVPEPSTWVLLVLGFGGFGILGYGKRSPA
jgi:hypothetical protein